MTSIAVTIAGSDSSGGAGIQADLKTFSALGVYGASVITALTAQNTVGVTAIHDVPPDFVTAQIDAVFSDLAVDAVKIGMLARTGVIEAVAAGLDRWRPANVVLDPVMVATSGDKLLAPDAIATLRHELLRRATVVTPNLPEAAALLDTDVAASETEMQVQAERILALGAQAVLIKGGHGAGAVSTDFLFDGTSVTRLSVPRIATRNTHGTGCTLSSAIAAGLAKGQNLADAVREAKAYVTAAIESQGRRLLAMGCPAVLIKGGHGQRAESTDYLVSGNGIIVLAAPRIATNNTHGTGCSLSSAIAAGLAKGEELETAVRNAKAWISAAIAAADRLGVGHGHGPIHHFHGFY